MTADTESPRFGMQISLVEMGYFCDDPTGKIARRKTLHYFVATSQEQWSDGHALGKIALPDRSLIRTSSRI